MPARFEAGTPAISQAIGLAAAFRWLDALGMDVCPPSFARASHLTRAPESIDHQNDDPPAQDDFSFPPPAPFNSNPFWVDVILPVG